jgi:hypothetical protein
MERRLADAGIVLDQDVALRQERHHDVVEHLLADLDRTRDVVSDAPTDRRRRLHLVAGDRAGRFDGLHLSLHPHVGT